MIHPFGIGDEPHFAGLVAWNSICEASQTLPNSFKPTKKHTNEKLVEMQLIVLENLSTLRSK